MTHERDPRAPTCPECGHEIPPEDPTATQVDRFLDDDSTQECGACSALWILLFAHMVEMVRAER